MKRTYKITILKQFMLMFSHEPVNRLVLFIGSVVIKVHIHTAVGS